MSVYNTSYVTPMASHNILFVEELEFICSSGLTDYFFCEYN